MKQRFLAGLLLVAAFQAPLGAAERILDYHADISVLANGSLDVTETIRVMAEGQQIRRGIYRDFPTDYKDRGGNRYRTGFEVTSVQRNGKTEAYHTERRSNGVRVYIGSPNRNISPGEHEYRLQYRTTRQLGFFNEYDELYWNVTGNGWLFPIERASATITLPGPVEASVLRNAFYTGLQNQSGSNAEFSVVDARHVSFVTTRALNPYEGLTVAVGWPKGLVHEPGAGERLVYFFKDNGAGIVLLLGWLFPLGWYLWSWNRHGRDPEKGVIIPRFEPPGKLSAAACSYVKHMGLRSQAFTAAIISLGVKGYLKIDEGDDEYTLHRREFSRNPDMSPGERVVLKELLPKHSPSITLDDKNHKDFLRARSGLEQALKTEYKNRLFKLNTIFMAPAVVMSIIAVIVAQTQQGSPFLWMSFAAFSIFLHGTFVYLLRAPTPVGREVMDEIEGFEMYLDTAEQDRLERMRSPGLTPEVFEQFLPYAFALGVQNSWCDRFAREFPREIAEGSYHPGWYSGDYRGLDGINHLSSDFSNDFSSAIVSASSPPGSSSGSGGGGFSGGGGGGGGGGGW